MIHTEPACKDQGLPMFPITTTSMIGQEVSLHFYNTESECSENLIYKGRSRFKSVPQVYTHSICRNLVFSFVGKLKQNRVKCSQASGSVSSCLRIWSGVRTGGTLMSLEGYGWRSVASTSTESVLHAWIFLGVHVVNICT